MKIYPSNILNYISENNVEDKIFFLYGSNFGLADEIYDQLLDNLNFDFKDPFCNVKISFSQLIDNENLLIDEISTFSAFNSCKNILLDIKDTNSIEIVLKIFQKTFSFEFKNYKIIILAGYLRSNNPLITGLLLI